MLGLFIPLPESTYRRLSTLSNHLSNVLPQWAGLNPKAYRVVERAPEGVLGGRAIVDGNVMRRWMELGAQKRQELAGRVGVDQGVVRADLEALKGVVGYL
jgi:cleavage and polyadenylation specificity factor subunit 1